jgi:DinB superfamily
VPLPSAADVLKAQLRHAWLNARWVLEDVTEDEYLWKPASPCWSVRTRGPSVRGWGSGQFVCEDSWPPPEPLPITTIAWRVIHLAAWTDVYRAWTFSDARTRLDDFEVPGDAAAGLGWLYRAQDDFTTAVDALDDESVFDLRPAHWGESLPVVHLVTSMLTEHVHHIAEIGVLRDLRRGHARSQPPPPPTRGPNWWLGTPSADA